MEISIEFRYIEKDQLKKKNIVDKERREQLRVPSNRELP